jgi:UDP-N-acetylglucosamine 2-epimerase
VFYDELGLAEPRHRLDVRSADHTALQAPIAAAIGAERPDLVVVLGDTNTTAAAARAAAGHGVPTAHVEAGLRSGDLAMPEERNRIEVDRLAAWLLCPDERSARTLRKEAVTGSVHVTGDVMADAARIFGPIARARVPTAHAPGSYVVATVHREANTAQPRLGNIVAGLNRLAGPVVFPAHPRTRAAIAKHHIALAPHVELVEPLGYLELTALVSRARVVVTDSGGLQKEAYWHGVPCVTARPSTEWVDTVLAGGNTLVDDDPDVLVSAVEGAIMPRERPSLYGDGHAAQRIAKLLYAASLDS